MGNDHSSTRTKPVKTLTEDKVNELSALSGYMPDQIRVWHAGFWRDCPTGKLSKKRFVEVYKEFYPTGNAKKFCEHSCRMFDTDNSGDIDFDEFLIAISITAQQDPKKKLEWAFRMYDIDQNGFIEKKEMKKILEAIFDLEGIRHEPASIEMKINQIFSQMDVDGDGKLSKDEFVSGCLKNEKLRKLLSPSAC